MASPEGHTPVTDSTDVSFEDSQHFSDLTKLELIRNAQKDIEEKYEPPVAIELKLYSYYEASVASLEGRGDDAGAEDNRKRAEVLKDSLSAQDVEAADIEAHAKLQEEAFAAEYSSHK